MSAHVQVRQHFTNIRKRAGKTDDRKIVNALVFGPPDHAEKLFAHHEKTARMKPLQMLMQQLTEKKSKGASSPSKRCLSNLDGRNILRRMAQ
jgi:hypothetical protein